MLMRREAARRRRPAVPRAHAPLGWHCSLARRRPGRPSRPPACCLRSQQAQARPQTGWPRRPPDPCPRQAAGLAQWWLSAASACGPAGRVQACCFRQVRRRQRQPWSSACVLTRPEWEGCQPWACGPWVGSVLWGPDCYPIRAQEGTPPHANPGQPAVPRMARWPGPGCWPGPGQCRVPDGRARRSWGGEAAVGHHRPQRGQAGFCEEQPGRPGCRLQAHEPAVEQALCRGRHLGPARLRAAAPGPELEAVGDAGQGGEELVELAADVVPFAGAEGGGDRMGGFAHGAA